MNKPLSFLLPLLFISLLCSPAVSSECIEGNCNNGRGTLKWTNSSSYTGDFRNGKANGYGEAIWNIGKKANLYVGEWKNDMPHGYGVYLKIDGGKYEGEWKEGQWHGKGTYTQPDGKKYIGEFRNGERVDYTD